MRSYTKFFDDHLHSLQLGIHTYLAVRPENGVFWPQVVVYAWPHSCYFLSVPVKLCVCVYFYNNQIIICAFFFFLRVFMANAKCWSSQKLWNNVG